MRRVRPFIKWTKAFWSSAALGTGNASTGFRVVEEVQVARVGPGMMLRCILDRLKVTAVRADSLSNGFARLSERA